LLEATFRRGIRNRARYKRIEQRDRYLTIGRIFVRDDRVDNDDG